MNKKRMAAYVVAAAMLLNVTPVMASQVNTATGSSTITGSGTVDGVDMSDVFSVTLPTNNALDFTVDPYGLLTATQGAVVSADDLADTGVITSASGSAALIKNESSVPVTVDVKLRGIVSGTATFVTGGSVVASGSSANLFLALIPSVTKSAVEADGTVTNYDASSYVIPITTNESTTKFQLKNADYEIEKGASGNTFHIVSEAGNYDSTVFKVGGLVNSKADWSKFSGASASSTLSIGAVFSFAKSPDTEDLDDTLGVYGLVSGGATNFTNDTSADSGVISGANMTASSEANVDFEVANFSVSSPYTITINDDRTITELKAADTPTSFNLAMNSVTIDNPNHTVTIRTGSFGSGAVGKVKYVKLKSVTGDIVIKLNCVS